MGTSPTYTLKYWGANRLILVHIHRLDINKGHPLTHNSSRKRAAA